MKHFFTFSLRKKYSRLQIMAGLLGLFTVALTPETQAQDETKPGKIYGGLGYFAPGLQQPSLKSLNSVLTKEGFAAAPTNYIALGGGGNTIFKNLVIGGEGYSFTGKNNTADPAGGALKTTLTGGY